MALAMVIFDALWASLGLLGQGRLLTIVQVVIQVGIGVVAFGLAAWLLGLTEFKTILTRVLRFRDKHSKVEVAPT
jgi:hypothetical protein